MQEKSNESSQSAQSKKIVELQQRIHELEESHNEQVQLINKYKTMSEDRTKFSLEVVNKSMMAVDLIRTYTSDNHRGVSELTL